MARLSPQNPRDLRASPVPLPVPAATAPSGPGPALWIAIGVGAVVLIAASVLIFRLASRTKRGGAAAGNVPANFFQQATSDFAEAKRLLDEGKLSDSAEKFAESQHYRSRAGDKSISAVQNFEFWCAVREKEYRAAAAAMMPTLPERVAAGKSSVAEVDTFLERFGTEDARAAWAQQRPGLERGAAAAAAAGAYRVEFAIQGIEGNSIDDLTPGDFTALSDAIAARIGSGPLLAVSAAAGVAPEKGLGYVRVNLVYVEATYRAQRTGQDSDIKVPAILNATIEVTTNKKKGKWDGLHEYTAEGSPPAKLTSTQLSGARVNLQRDLLAKVVKQVSSNTKPARRAVDVAAE